MSIHLLQYDIIGHSGEGHNFEIVKAGTPPKNNKDRLDAVKVVKTIELGNLFFSVAIVVLKLLI